MMIVGLTGLSGIEVTNTAIIHVETDSLIARIKEDDDGLYFAYWDGNRNRFTRDLNDVAQHARELIRARKTREKITA